MAVCVVDMLEIVYVDHRKRQRFFLPYCPGYFAIQLILDRGVVEQAVRLSRTMKERSIRERRMRLVTEETRCSGCFGLVRKSSPPRPIAKSCVSRLPSIERNTIGMLRSEEHT